MNKKHLYRLIIFGLICIYLILAYKNPLGDRSLLPNLEPYPDSLYYSYPAWSFINGTGFGMNFNNDSIPTIVPPGYSIWLIPFIALFNDVRGFYLANLFLQMGTIIFLVIALGNIFKNKKQQPATIFAIWILVTNYYFYTLPSLLMAENITIFTVCLGFYLLTSKITTKKMVLAGLTGIFFWLIKLSNFILGISFLLLYGVKISRDVGVKKFVRFSIVCVAMVVVYYFGYFNKNLSLTSINIEANSSFSTDYFFKNINFYLRAITGLDTRYLWFTEKIISPLWAIMAVMGLVCALMKKNFQSLVIFTIILISSLLVFMSFFYYPDSRYIFSLLPLLIFLIVLPIAFLSRKIAWLVVVILIGLQLLIPQFNEKQGESKIVSLKKQIGLNFRYTEDPWNYKAILHINKFLSDKPDAYMGTFLPPFYVEMFKKGNYYFLPISQNQEFSGKNRPLIDRMYRSDGSILKMYERLLMEDKHVYITNAYVTNSSNWSNDLELLKKSFDAILIESGCLETCNIYLLKR